MRRLACKTPSRGHLLDTRQTSPTSSEPIREPEFFLIG